MYRVSFDSKPEFSQHFHFEVDDCEVNYTPEGQGFLLMGV